jgi:hypothetical protein
MVVCVKSTELTYSHPNCLLGFGQIGNDVTSENTRISFQERQTETRTSGSRLIFLRVRFK